MAGSIDRCPMCGRGLSPVEALYRELTDSVTTWVDVVWWVSVGASLGGAIAIAWGVS